MSLTLNEVKIQMLLDKLSNGDPVDIPESLIEEAGDQFKEALRKQLTRKPGPFRLRMSNIGKPLCQLQREKQAADPNDDLTAPRRPYNHIMRMMIGDSVEVLSRLVMKAAGVNVTSDGDHVELEVAGQVIKGDSDIDVEGRVDDIKSCSPWAFKYKWPKGYQNMAANDGFGYVGQLVGYAEGQEKELGGWWVWDKSSGECLYLAAEPSEEDMEALIAEREHKVIAIRDNHPFKRCFEPYEEVYWKKKTGAMRVPEECKMCDFHRACWPEAKFLPQPGSRAKTPARFWYTEHPDMETPE